MIGPRAPRISAPIVPRVILCSFFPVIIPAIRPFRGEGEKSDRKICIIRPILRVYTLLENMVVVVFLYGFSCNEIVGRNVNY